jgi:tetratricopeptide (TPR) repeat protein
MTRSQINTLPALAAALALLAGAGCSSKKKDDDAAASFPPSVTAKASDKTATLPAKPLPEPMSEPPAAVSSVEAPEPAPVTYGEMIAAGKRALAAGDSGKALEMFTAAAGARPYAYPKVQMARALLQMGDHDNARAHVEAAVEMDGASTFAWNTLGRVELAAGDRDAAIVSFERAAENDRHNSYAWNNLGFTLIEEGRYQEAAEALENATSGADPKPYMWNNLAMAYEHLDLLDEARAAYRQAADLGSEKAAASLVRLEGVTSIRTGGEIPGETDPGLEIDIETDADADADAGVESEDGDLEDQNDAIVGC